MPNTPVFVVDKPGFMGLGGVSEHFEIYDGEVTVDDTLDGDKFMTIYIHRTLEDRVGYDIATLAQGHMANAERQGVIVIDRAGRTHAGVMVLITDKFDNYRAYIVTPEEADLALQDLISHYGQKEATHA